MIFPPLNELMTKVDSRYSLVVAIAKRARQLSSEEDSLVKCDSAKPVNMAIHELYQDAIEVINCQSETVAPSVEDNVEPS